MQSNMKKIFIFATILILALNLYFHLHHEGDNRTPYSEFQTRIGMAPMKEYHDPDFGYSIQYPCFFQQEENTRDDFTGHTRFSYTDHTNIVLESYVTQNQSKDLAACADSLANLLHAGKTLLPDHSAFILSGPVYENGVRIDGYSHYDKFIKSGKMLFVYSLTYPDTYKPALPRLFRLIEDWKVLGAY